MTNQCAVQVKNVSKKIKKNYVLSSVNVNFCSGKVYGITGINGSGKTMLFRAISGLITLTEGEIKFFKDDVNIGVIIENPGFLQSYTGLENLKLLAQIRNIIGEQEMKDAMLKVGLDPDDARRVKEYSLGMRQKLAIAQAVMEHPDILILDEPFRGLDTGSVKNIYDLLKDFRDCGCTILLSTHNPADVSAICDEVYEMRNGSLFTEMQ
jgi:ABC-2 type transport system ATP-binding protein